jgi:glutathione S-transferase
MKLYWGLHTCAIGIHILIEEIGCPYETEKLDVAGGATHWPPFSAINPKGKVPTLVRDDGSVLIDFSAISIWLAGQMQTTIYFRLIRKQRRDRSRSWPMSKVQFTDMQPPLPNYDHRPLRR